MTKAVSAFLTCLAFIFCFLPGSFAAKWRVNNSGIPANFTSLQQAVGSASVNQGDTLYVEGSVTNYGNVELTKRLVIIGPGYFLGQNPETQANLVQASINYLTFSTGSKGSVMTGMTVTSWTTVQDTSITLSMNNLAGVTVFNPSINNNISRNYIYYLNISGSHGNNISNNIFTKEDVNSCNCFEMGNTSSATVRHNIFKGCQSIHNCTYENNIATGTVATGTGSFTFTNSVVANNIGASTQYGTSNGNMENIDMSQVFVNTGSADGRYQLLPGSPATGAGTGGTDCGVFGGSTPYVLSGMPGIPSVWYTNINGSTVTVKAISH